MEVILDDAVDPHSLSKGERGYCLNLLEEILQSETRPYDAYFSSKPTPGSIVEDIAEISANVVNLEKQIRSLLVEHKSEVLAQVLGGSSGTKLADIRNELDQLWEFDEGTGEKGPPKEELLFDEILDPGASIKKRQDDQFQTALNKLKQRVSQSEAHAPGSLGDLASVLENLSSITDFMELPFLARTCIRTGHYQEAVMLYTHTKSLQLKFQGSTIVRQVCDSVLNEITTTMLTGLVKLLSTNVTVNSLKKILNYLAAIPPFDNTETELLLRVFLHMRFNFIQREIDSYSLKMDPPNEALMEMMVKRKIEVLREYTYMSSNVFMEMFSFPTDPVRIDLAAELKPEATTAVNEDDTPAVKEDGTPVAKEDDTPAAIKEDNTPAAVNEDVTDATPAAVKEDDTPVAVNEDVTDATPAVVNEDVTDATPAAVKEDDTPAAINEDVTDATPAAVKGDATDDTPMANEDVTDATPAVKEDDTPAAVKEDARDVTPGAKEDATPAAAKADAPIQTNALILQFINECIGWLLKDFSKAELKHKLSDSVCLQLIYCSFRLDDLNQNYHKLFLNKIYESQLFSAAQIRNAVQKRRDLASRYS